MSAECKGHARQPSPPFCLLSINPSDLRFLFTLRHHGEEMPINGRLLEISGLLQHTEKENYLHDYESCAVKHTMISELKKTKKNKQTEQVNVAVVNLNA